VILVDLNQVAFSTITINSGSLTVDENLIRHIILNCIRSYKSKFGKEYGEIVIATDNREYWRRVYFPYYKAHRKKARDDSGLNWPVIFECMDKIKNELKTVFPYKFIDVVGAEADDVISIIVQEADYNEDILIISGDKDFIQLQALKPLVKQWDPIRKRWLNHNNPEGYLAEHIIRGDKGDGIPNIKSASDVFVNGKRQSTITAGMIAKWSSDGVPEELKSNYNRNKKLIDLTQIPKEVKLNIIEEFNKEPEGSRGLLHNYFFKNNLANLMSSIGDF